MNDDCVRARGWLAQWADGDLAAGQTAWIEAHWKECVACRGERDEFQVLDGRLQSFGARIKEPTETLMDRARFLESINNDAERRLQRRLACVPAMASFLAAAAMLLVWLPRPASRPVGIDENGFVPVPYFAPLTSYERSSVVSMQIPVAELLADGYGIAADPTSVVQADVLLGEDGSMHAVRLAANQLLKGQ